MLFGAMALQNSVLHWAANHRSHHQFVDDNDRDPYSAGRGLWFSHIGWMLRRYPSGDAGLQRRSATCRRTRSSRSSTATTCRSRSA